MTLDEVIKASPVRVLSEEYYVSKVDHATGANYFAAIADGIETTVIASAADHESVAASPEREGPFRVLRLEIAVPFSAPGFIAAATGVLADAGVNVFMISTFSFDYVLVKAADLDTALGALTARGFPVA